jgi:hypothetical protein
MSAAAGHQRWHRVDKTYRDVTDRCKHCGRLRYHVPTFFQATERKMINCACSASLKWVFIRSSSNQMHASSNLPSMRTKKVGTLVTSLYVSTLWYGLVNFIMNFWTSQRSSERSSQHSRKSYMKSTVKPSKYNILGSNYYQNKEKSETNPLVYGR